MNLPVEVLEAVAGGRCVLFAGSRFAAEARELAGQSALDQAGLAAALGWRRPRDLMATIRPGAAARGPVIPSVAEGAALAEAQLGRAGLERRFAELVEGDRPSAAHRVALQRFPLIYTTSPDTLFEAAARDLGRPLELLPRGEARARPDPARPALVQLRGSFSRPGSLVLTRADLARPCWEADARATLREMLRKQVIFFVGHKPDDEEMEQLWAELSECYGGELPRCHLAVAQGRINDYLWQKWVWRGLLLFTADPVECLEELDRRLQGGV